MITTKSEAPRSIFWPHVSQEFCAPLFDLHGCAPMGQLCVPCWMQSIQLVHVYLHTTCLLGKRQPCSWSGPVPDFHACCRDGDSGGGEAPPKQPAKSGRGRGRCAGHVPKGRGGGSK